MKNFSLSLIAMVLISCAGESQSSQEAPPLEYLIAYNVYVPSVEYPDNYDVFVMNMDGSGRKNITNNPDVAWTYLAHDNTIFFISDRDTAERSFLLYEMDPAGKSIRQITDFLLQDSWMGVRNNGSELIVKPHPTVDSALYRMNRNGGIISKMYPGTPYASDPSFSNDGTQIAFIGKSESSRQLEGYEEEIYVLNSDGSNLHRASNYPEADTTAQWFDIKAGPPRWHPIENFISFQSKQEGKYKLIGVSPDGERQWHLLESEWNQGWHDWSPDGKWLAVELFDDNQSQFHIGLVDWETKNMEILTDTTYQYQQAPVFVRKP